jgi:hypothetical protein
MEEVEEKQELAVVSDVPHLGQITINAVVYKQTPKGDFDPKAIWHDSFAINFQYDSVEKCVEDIKRRLETFKNE